MVFRDWGDCWMVGGGDAPGVGHIQACLEGGQSSSGSAIAFVSVVATQQPVGSDRLILVSIAGCVGNESVIQLK